MSINGIGSRQYLISTLGVLDPTSTDETSSDPLLSTTSSTSTTSSLPSMLDSSTDSTNTSLQTNFSTAASLLSTLSKLQTKDPAAFKEITSEISDNLHKAADSSTDSTQSYALNNLAARFSNASATGSLTSVATTKTENSLRGYGSANSNLVSSYLSQGLNSDLYSAMNTMVAGTISSVLSDE